MTLNWRFLVGWAFILAFCAGVWAGVVLLVVWAVS